MRGRVTRHGRWLLTTALLAVSIREEAQGQVLGTFAWQLQPFCNVVRVTVTQQSGSYTLDGFDDQCGASQRAPLVGLATPNPDGSVGLGLHIVTVAGGRPVSVEARISLATLGGAWTDSAGNSGTAVFGGTATGPRRPAPTIPGAAIAAGSITAQQLAPATAAAVVAAVGTCPSGAYLRGVRPDGSALCEPVAVPPTTSVAANAASPLPSIAFGRDGLPVVAYPTSTAQLGFARCLQRSCVSAQAYPILTVTRSGYAPRIVIGADGFPIIVHIDTNEGGIRVTHCNDAICSTITSTVIVRGAAFDEPVIAVGSDGLPIVAYGQGAIGLRVAHCENAACTAFRTATVDGSSRGGFKAAMAIGADGVAIIAHRDPTNGDLRVTHCNDVVCTSATSVNVDTAGNVGDEPAIMIGADQRALIAHIDPTTSTLRFTHCNDLACSAATTVTAGQGRYPAIAAGPDGLPTVAFTEVVDFELKVGRCADARCSTMTAALAPTGQPAAAVVSMALDTTGIPTLAHVDFSSSTLRVTRCGTVTCQ